VVLVVVDSTSRLEGSGEVCGASAAMAGTRPSRAPKARIREMVRVFMGGVPFWV
jgi:hypothetical protein